ncbi:MAG: phosphotransferase [Deltaproteobacteria bacterium]|nr:phosphotransferase [Deltaproteobacteria bacterium]
MNNAANPLEQVSDKLMAYLRTELNNNNIVYDIPLTPIVGGYETFTYHFKLKGVQPELAKPLVLRLFQEYRSPGQAIGESAVQNALAAQGYPVPSVLFTGTDKRHLGGAFLIMEFLPGESMLAAAEEDMPLMLGKAHAALHNIDPTPLRKALTVQGLDERDYRLNRRLNGLLTQSKIFPWLEESVQWLIENRPPEPEYPAVCHGDFHPLNILIKEGRVTAVLDWPGFMIGEAVMDVAFTVFLCSTIAGHLLPTRNWDEVMSKYLEAYQSERSLDMTNLNYYRVMRCIIAFVDGAEGQAVWTSPSVLKSLIGQVRDIAKIWVVLPG